MVGGDGFLDMPVEPGHEVVVEGYDGEPYLRFRADGTVQENQNSPATYLNRNRYAGAEVPAAIQGDDRPAAGLEDRRPRTATTPGTTTASTSWARTRRSSPACPRAGRSSGAAGCRSPSTARRWSPTATTGCSTRRARCPGSPSTVVVTAAIVVAGRRRPVLVAGVALLVGGVVALGVGLGAERRHPARGRGHAAHRRPPRRWRS